MSQCLRKPGRIQGCLAAALLSSLALFAANCAQENNMATNPSTVSSPNRSEGSGIAHTDFPQLGSASSFAVLGGSTVTNTGHSLITGDLGVSPGTVITGVDSGMVIGSIHAGDSLVAQAQSDLAIAYNALAGLPCNTELTGLDLGGMTLEPGVYCFSSSAQLTGTLVLDARGDQNEVFIFQIASALVTATGSSVVMIGGGRECNVFWQVGSSATLGTGTAFAGNVLASASITLNNGVSLSGRALARTGAVTMDADTVSALDCERGPRRKCKVKVTGGGSIPVDGGFASFGFGIIQKKDGRLDGQLQYNNRANDSRMHIRDFTSLLVVGDTATFVGSGTINHLPVTVTVTVTEKGQPGSNDSFSISIADGPIETGTLRSGNIKIHNTNCGEDDSDGKDHDDDNDDDGDDGAGKWGRAEAARVVSP